jgi:hypothetical protein
MPAMVCGGGGTAPLSRLAHLNSTRAEEPLGIVHLELTPRDAPASPPETKVS